MSDRLAGEAGWCSGRTVVIFYCNCNVVPVSVCLQQDGVTAHCQLHLVYTTVLRWKRRFQAEGSTPETPSSGTGDTVLVLARVPSNKAEVQDKAGDRAREEAERRQARIQTVICLFLCTGNTHQQRWKAHMTLICKSCIK